MFEFYERIYYLDSEEKYPHTKEQRGRFMGVADQVGDALTFTILTEDNKLLTRSVVRSAVNPTRYGYENKRLLSEEDLKKQQTEEQAQEEINTAKYFPPTTPLDDPLRDSLRDQLKGRSGPIPASDNDNGVKPRRSPRLQQIAPASTQALQTNSMPLTNQNDTKLIPKTKLSNVGLTVPKWIGWDTEIHLGESKMVDLSDKKIRKLLIQIQCMDRISPNLVSGCIDDRHEWRIHKVIRHKYVNDECHVKVIWGNGTTSWLTLESVALHEPYVCVQYARKHQIMDKRRMDMVQGICQRYQQVCQKDLCIQDCQGIWTKVHVWS